MPSPFATVVVPTYNEAENIEALVTELLALPQSPWIIVVDDNSPDGTDAILDRLGAASERVIPIHRPGKLGLGTAHIAGFKRALEIGSEFILSMDADFSHSPRYVPGLLGRMADADLCIGSRYVRGGGAAGCSRARVALSRWANMFARALLGLQATDCTAGFRCYRRDVLESIDLDSIFSNGYSFLIELLHRAQQRGFRVAEVPILFENRRRGTSKISRKEIAKAMYTVLRLRWPGLPWERLAPRGSTSGLGGR